MIFTQAESHTVSGQDDQKDGIKYLNQYTS